MVNGTIIAVGPSCCITVDYWRSVPGQNVLARFCTHDHADHIQGLSETWTGGYTLHVTSQYMICPLHRLCSLLSMALPMYPGHRAAHILLRPDQGVAAPALAGAESASHRSGAGRGSCADSGSL